jgi:hypothetical protein
VNHVPDHGVQDHADGQDHDEDHVNHAGHDDSKLQSLVDEKISDLSVVMIGHFSLPFSQFAAFEIILEKPVGFFVFGLKHQRIIIIVGIRGIAGYNHDGDSFGNLEIIDDEIRWHPVVPDGLTLLTNAPLVKLEVKMLKIGKFL